MSVDKFGLTPGIADSITPVHKYAVNLDDLVDVKGFHEPGKIGAKYCLELNKDKVYIRSELPIGSLADFKSDLAVNITDLENIKNLENTKEDLKNTKRDLRITKDDVEVIKDDLEVINDNLKNTKAGLENTKAGLENTKEDLKNTKDDLEVIKDDLNYAKNIKGFDLPGNIGTKYGLEFNKYNAYVRSELPEIISFKDLLQVGVPASLLLYDNGSIRVLPTKHNWDIDIQLRSDKVVLKGGKIQKIINSGRVFGSLIPLNRHEDAVVLKNLNGDYFLHMDVDKLARVILRFDSEFANEKKEITDFPVGATIVIDGIILESFVDPVEIINGVFIILPGELDKPLSFRVVIKRTQDKDIISSDTIIADKDKDGTIKFNHITINEQYMIKRIRFTTLPVTPEIIKYL